MRLPVALVRRVRLARALGLAAVALLAGILAPGWGCGGRGATADRTAPVLADLSDIAVFEEQFNADRGMPRLVLLLSPT